MEQRTRWTTWTLRPSVDGDRFTHNPEVEGSNPSPLLVFAGQAPFLVKRGLLRLGNCSKTCSSNSPPRGPAVRRRRRGDMGRDSRDVMDAAARDLWVPGPEVAQVPTGLFLLVTESLSRVWRRCCPPGRRGRMSRMTLAGPGRCRRYLDKASRPRDVAVDWLERRAWCRHDDNSHRAGAGYRARPGDRLLLDERPADRG
jgi:hypothetical protein